MRLPPAAARVRPPGFENARVGIGAFPTAGVVEWQALGFDWQVRDRHKETTRNCANPQPIVSLIHA